MGTSGKYGGGGGKGIVPTWVDDPSAPVGSSPASDASTADGGDDVGDGAGDTAPSGPGAPSQPASTPGTTPSTGGSLRGARTLFNKFAQGGGGSQFGRAAGRYVRSGMGGSTRASRALGSSRQAGSGLLTFARDFTTAGPAEALRPFNLEAYAQSPVEEVFPQILEALCPPGGTIDEAIARQAMLDAIARLCENFDGPISALSPDNLRDLFLDFVASSIEGRILNDIGAKLVDLPESISALEGLSQDIHDFIDNCVHNSLGTSLQNVASIPRADVQATVDSIYRATFDYIETFADES